MLHILEVPALPVEAAVHRSGGLTLLLLRTGLPLNRRQSLMLELLTPAELRAALDLALDRPVLVPYTRALRAVG